MASALMIASGTSCGSPDRREPHEPGAVREVGPTARAASSASRVLPTPPGPVSVRSRTCSDRNRSPISPISRARPIVRFGGRGNAPYRAAAAPTRRTLGRRPGSHDAARPARSLPVAPGSPPDGSSRVALDLQRLVLGQHGLVHLLQFGPRLDAEPARRARGGPRGRPPAPRSGARCDRAPASAARSGARASDARPPALAARRSPRRAGRPRDRPPRAPPAPPAAAPSGGRSPSARTARTPARPAAARATARAPSRKSSPACSGRPAASAAVRARRRARSVRHRAHPGRTRNR